jgi:hypothetical protein
MGIYVSGPSFSLLANLQASRMMSQSIVVIMANHLPPRAAGLRNLVVASTRPLSKLFIRPLAQSQIITELTQLPSSVPAPNRKRT